MPAFSPDSVTLSASLLKADSMVKVSWTGGSANNGLPVSTLAGFRIAYCDSANNSTWGSWSASTSYAKTSSGGSMDFNVNPTPGGYRKFRVQTYSNDGYSSSWRESASSVRTNIPPTAPTAITASPEQWSSGSVTLSWSGAKNNTSSIKSHLVSRRRTTAEGAWYAWSDMAEITSSATSGSWTDESPLGDSNTKTHYRVQIKDSLSDLSDWVESNEVVKSIPPNSPVIIAPVSAATFSAKPRILITVKAHSEAQVLWLKIDSGTWTNSVDNTVSFSPSGTFINATNVVYTCDTLTAGAHTLSVCAIDTKLQSPIVTSSFTVNENPFESIISGETNVKVTHITSLRTAINAARTYYGLNAYSWKYSLSAKNTNVLYFPFHVTELRKALTEIISNINTFRSGAITPTTWEGFGSGRPRAAVMTQLQEVLLNL